MITYGRSPVEIAEDTALAVLESVQIVEPVFECEAVRKLFPRWRAWTLDELLERIDRIDRVRWLAADALITELGYSCKWGASDLRRFNKALKALGV